MEWLIAAAVVVLAIVAGVLLTRRSPARLPDEDRPGGRHDPTVTDRPAGPGAEATGLQAPGAPSPRPTGDDGVPPSPT